MSRIKVDMNIYQKQRPRTLDNVVGLVFDRLTTKSIAGHNKHRQMLILCECSCGNETVVVKQRLFDGRVKSCGCLRQEKYSNDLESAVMSMLRNKAKESGLDPDAKRRQEHAARINLKPEST